MIELILTKYSKDESFHMISSLIMWIVEVLGREENHDIILDGYTVAHDEKRNDIFTVLICDEGCHKHFMQILQEPPEMFKGRYIPRVICLEPEPVNEIIPETDSEDEVT